MESKNTLEVIEEIIKKQLGKKAKITGKPSTGLFNTSYEIVNENKSYIIRIAPPDNTPFLFYERKMMLQEPGLHKLLKEKTSIPVATITHHDFNRKLIDRDYLIMEKLPGKSISESHVDYSKILLEVGKYLAELHSIQTDKYGYLGEHHPMEAQDNWFSAFSIMWKKLLQDIDNTGIYNKQEINRLEKLLHHNKHHFNENFPASLLHMDIWSQNILAENNEVTGIVDWDRALWGDPEIEFAVLDYCGISEPAFWKGYKKPRKKDMSATIRWVFYFLYEAQKYIVISYGRHKDTRRAMSYKTYASNVLKEYMKVSLLG